MLPECSTRLVVRGAATRNRCHCHRHVNRNDNDYGVAEDVGGGGEQRRGVTQARRRWREPVDVASPATGDERLVGGRHPDLPPAGAVVRYERDSTRRALGPCASIPRTACMRTS